MSVCKNCKCLNLVWVLFKMWWVRHKMSSNTGITNLTQRQTTYLVARTWLFHICVIYFISTSAGSARQKKNKTQKQQQQRTSWQFFTPRGMWVGVREKEQVRTATTEEKLFSHAAQCIMYQPRWAEEQLTGRNQRGGVYGLRRCRQLGESQHWARCVRINYGLVGVFKAPPQPRPTCCPSTPPPPPLRTCPIHTHAICEGPPA